MGDVWHLLSDPSKLEIQHCSGFEAFPSTALLQPPWSWFLQQYPSDQQHRCGPRLSGPSCPSQSVSTFPTGSARFQLCGLVITGDIVYPLRLYPQPATLPTSSVLIPCHVQFEAQSSLVLNGYIALAVRRSPGQPPDPSLSLDKVKENKGRNKLNSKQNTSLA